MRSVFSTVSMGQAAAASGSGLSGARVRDEWANGPLPFEMRLRRARLGLVVGLTGILMIFISFTSAYVVRQGLPTLDSRANMLIHDWFPVRLPGLLLWNTAMLLLSSGTMEVARRQLARDAARARSDSPDSVAGDARLEWLALTAVLGLCFLAGQWTAWRQLANSGFYISTNPSSSFFYLLTGTHGAHLIGGVLALLAAGAVSILRRPIESRAVIVDIAAWYWHFMAILWVYILCLLEFAR